MGRDAKSNTPAFKRKGARPRPLLGLLCFIFTLLTAISLFDYDPNQVGKFDTEATETNLIGDVGAQFAFYAMWCIGMASWFVPMATAWMSYLFFRSYGYVLNIRKLLSVLILLVSASVFWRIFQIEALDGDTIASDPNFFPYGQSMGGLVGMFIYDNAFREWLSMVGTLVVFGVLSLFALWFCLTDNLASDLKRTFSERSEKWAQSRAEKQKAKAEKEAIERANRAGRESQKKGTEKVMKAREEAEKQKVKDAPPPPKKASGGLFGFGGKKAEPTGDKVQKSGPKPFEPIVEGPDEPVIPSPSPKSSASSPKQLVEPSVESEDPGSGPPSRPQSSETKGLKLEKSLQPQQGGGLKIIASEQTRKAVVRTPEKRGNYVFPPMSLLSDPPPVSEEDNTESHQQTADALVQTLEEFGVKVTMGEVHAGPVITRYDVYPAPGVRVERIVNLDKNLALGLKATSVRILAPVPGKGCVGIEVPNRKPQAVFIRDILESEDWVETKAEIPIALGKEVSGKPLVADLTKMPHLLIAGSTGSGKTVCINAIITSLLYHSSPEDIRFVMVDPKIVEMQVYNSLPQMLIPVVTDPKKVPNALKYLLTEMERRYQIFAGIGVRNIAGFNAKMAKDRKERSAAEERAAELDAALTPEERAAAANAVSVPRDPGVDEVLPDRLPYIVCIVDELADLMMVAPADIETGIARLAQLARAAGIHLILATQRPSVNVITGVIKANLPSRIAFKVASKVDSRTILDTMGADQLIGKGDMLFLPPGSADLVRSQGAFVGDDEINGIVDYIKEKNGEPEFDELFQRSVEEGADGGGDSDSGDWDDELVPDAIEVIRTSKRASTSMLQRRLKIGYNRAARIMEILEAEGIVGPENGSSPREILKDLD